MCTFVHVASTHLYFELTSHCIVDLYIAILYLQIALLQMSHPFLSKTLILNPDGYIPEEYVVRVPIGTKLSIVARHGTPASLLPFYINYPSKVKNSKFERHKFHRLYPMNSCGTSQYSFSDIVYEVDCSQPGAYQYFFEKISHGLTFLKYSSYFFYFSS